MDAGLLCDKAAMFREMTEILNIQSFSATIIVLTFMYFPIGLGLNVFETKRFTY